MKTRFVWDNHVCLPLRPDDERFRAQLARHAAAGFNVVSVNIGYGETTMAAVVDMLASFERWVARHEDRYAIPSDYTALEAIVASGRTAIVFDLEGADALVEAPHRLAELARRGLRWALLVYNRRNVLGSGCHETQDEGLTRRGKELVRALEAAGIVVCGAHAGPRTARELLEFVRRPAIFSHANAGAVTRHPRNVDDDLIDLCAAKGGVIGITGIGLFLGDPAARTPAVLRHVRHVADRVGAAHVALALDFSYDQEEVREALRHTAHLFPPELGYTPDIVFAPPEQLGEIRTALRVDGFSDQHQADILGGNWARIAREGWLS